MNKHRIVLFRGLAGNIFSRGLDKWMKNFKSRPQDGIMPNTCSVHSYTEVKKVANQLVSDYRSGKINRVTLIGHSLGARAAIKLQSVLYRHKVPVCAVISLDYVKNIVGLNDLKGHPKISNFHIRSNEKSRPRKLKNAVERKFPDLNHIQLDDDPKVHDLITKYVWLNQQLVSVKGRGVIHINNL